MVYAVLTLFVFFASKRKVDDWYGENLLLIRSLLVVRAFVKLALDTFIIASFIMSFKYLIKVKREIYAM